MQSVDLRKRVRERFEALPRVLRKAPVYLGLSAGMDSSVLAAVALALRAHLPPLRFLHVNYGLRLPDCDREEEMLRAWAKQVAVPIEVLRLKPRGKPKNLQAWAREKRFAFFRRVLHQRSAGEGTVWLAHHLRDQAETVLLRLLRGAGLRGVAGMSGLESWEGLRLFRPLLDVPYEALRLYARHHRVLFRRDRSNWSDAYLRNRVRRRILPLFEKENPNIEETLFRFAQRSEQVSEALDLIARQWLRRAGRGARLSLARLRRQPPGLQTAILEQWLKARNSGAQSWNTLLPRLQSAVAGQKSLELALKGGKLRVGSRYLEYLGS